MIHYNKTCTTLCNSWLWETTAIFFRCKGDNHEKTIWLPIETQKKFLQVFWNYFVTDVSASFKLLQKMSKRRREREVGIAALVSSLQKKGIQLVAVDFDQTLITFHSGGVWKDSVDKLVSKVRPCIRDLMQTCLDRDINVCIVTYFMQPWVIKELLQKIFRRWEKFCVVFRWVYLTNILWTYECFITVYW